MSKFTLETLFTFNAHVAQIYELPLTLRDEMYSFSAPLIEYKILKKNCRETKGLILGFILLRGLN